MPKECLESLKFKLIEKVIKGDLEQIRSEVNLLIAMLPMMTKKEKKSAIAEIEACAVKQKKAYNRLKSYYQSFLD